MQSRLVLARRSTVAIVARAKKSRTIDDPGGRKARLEKLYGYNTILRPDDLVSIMLRKTRRVYDVDLTCDMGSISNISNISNISVEDEIPNLDDQEQEYNQDQYNNIVSIHSNQNTLSWCLKIGPGEPLAVDAEEYMAKLRRITDVLYKWGVGHIVRDHLEALNKPLHPGTFVEIDLGLRGRLKEFEL